MTVQIADNAICMQFNSVLQPNIGDLNGTLDVRKLALSLSFECIGIG